MTLKTTPLHALHRELGAKLVNFAGWEMPVQFTGVMKEHLHTRAQAGLFDVSHMGQVLIHATSGDVADTATALETVIPASVAGLKVDRQRYGIFTDAGGGVLDDLMFTRREDHFYLVVNASRVEHDLALLRAVDGIEVTYLTDRALLALQGPDAEAALSKLVPAVTDLVFMDSVILEWDAQELWVSRSGYTGEDGFEISVPAASAERFARALLSMEAVEPAGLGARDSLRLEAGMCLYGNDLTSETTPAEAAIGWAIPKVRRTGGSRAGGFPGAERILAELDEAPTRIRRGLRPESRAPIREGVELFRDEMAAEPIGEVSSGGFSPTLNAPIAMGFLPADLVLGDTVFAELRGKRLSVTVQDLPFVPHAYKR